MAIEVILREDIDTLGDRGDVVKVAPGYARNFLLPRRLAVTATESNKKIVEQERSAHLRREAVRISEAQELGKMMSGVEVTIEQKAGEHDQLFGSVTAQDIANALDKQGYKVERKNIHLEDHIKTLGDFKVALRLHKEVTIEIPVHVISDDPNYESKVVEAVAEAKVPEVAAAEPVAQATDVAEEAIEED